MWPWKAVPVTAFKSRQKCTVSFVHHLCSHLPFTLSSPSMQCIAPSGYSETWDKSKNARRRTLVPPVQKGHPRERNRASGGHFWKPELTRMTGQLERKRFPRTSWSVYLSVISEYSFCLSPAGKKQSVWPRGSLVVEGTYVFVFLKSGSLEIYSLGHFSPPFLPISFNFSSWHHRLPVRNPTESHPFYVSCIRLSPLRYFSGPCWWLPATS